MGRLIIIAAIFAGAAMVSYAQQDTSRFAFLKHVSFKNGKGTVVVRVLYQELHRTIDAPIFTTLKKQGKLRYRDYFRSCCGGTAMRFRMPGTSQEYDVVMRDNVPFNSGRRHIGEALYVTLLAFKNAKEYGDPFFVIINVSAEDPSKKRLSPG